MSSVFHRTPGHPYPAAVRGEGAYIVDAEGRRYLDASGGAAVSCLGHSHPAVVAAVKAQLDALPFAHTAFFTNPGRGGARRLPGRARAARPRPRLPRLGRVGSRRGGAQGRAAVFVERGEPGRRRFVARRQSYHGSTLGALALSGNPARRRPYEPLLLEVERVSACYPYRERRAGETDETYGERLAGELDATVRRLGPETVIAFVAETVAGATLGAVPPCRATSGACARSATATASF